MYSQTQKLVEHSQQVISFTSVKLEMLKGLAQLAATASENSLDSELDAEAWRGIVQTLSECVESLEDVNENLQTAFRSAKAETAKVQ